MDDEAKGGKLSSKRILLRTLPAAGDGLLAIASLWLSLALRFEGRIPANLLGRAAVLSPAFFFVLIIVATWRGVYRSLSQYASLGELVRLSQAVAISTAILLLVAKFERPDEHYLPLSVPIVTGLILLVGMGGVRLLPRLIGRPGYRRAMASGAERALIAGAGGAGEMICRDLIRNSSSRYLPVGFLDDSSSKQGRRIHGVPVIGALSDLAEAVSRTDADLVIFAIPSAPSRLIRQILSQASAAGAKTKIVPGLHDAPGPPVTLTDIRDPDIADLIGRKPARIDRSEIMSYTKEKTVLVTGAAGSIGSELCRQLLKFGPHSLWLLDNNESALFEINQELADQAIVSATSVKMLLADIRDRTRMRAVFGDLKPQVVFHAAAYKHVPIMEDHPAEAISTNLTGSRNLAESAIATGTEKFVLISTDKAVDPQSVMGASKRLAEMVLRDLACDSGTVFSSVRFGNVLGTRGSVVPIFLNQIRQGLPLTVTHPEATRFFMTVEEACLLILQAAAIGRGGDTLILDMGEPVKILELAERMRDLLSPEVESRAEIRITGIRPGEKLHEQLWDPNEKVIPSGRERIKKIENVKPTASLRTEELELLEGLARRHEDPERLRELLFSLAAGASFAAAKESIAPS